MTRAHVDSVNVYRAHVAKMMTRFTYICAHVNKATERSVNKYLKRARRASANTDYAATERDANRDSKRERHGNADY
jgi:hypothetical protein